MATKNLKSLTFPELDNTYVVPQVDATLSIEGRPADAEAVGDALETKADVTDVDVKADKNGDVAIAERLYGGKYTENSEPYFFRPVPVDMAGSVEECIVGGSLAWNQLVDSSRFISATSGDVTATPNDDGSITITVANALSADKTIPLTANTGTSYFRVPVGHKFVIYDDNPQFSNCDYREEYSGTSLGWNTIKTKATNNAIFLCLKLFSGTPSGTYKIRPQIIDLTALFGSSTIADYIYSLEQATAGAGVAWVKRYIDLDKYHEYDAGSIQSVEGLVSHDVVGKNLCDVSNTEIGTAWNGASNTARARLVIPCMPSTIYTLSINGTNSVENVLSSDGASIPLSQAGASFTTTKTFTTGADSHYIVVAFSKTAIKQSDVDALNLQLELGSVATQYEPYEKHSYPLDSDVVLRGVPKLVTDHIEFDGDKYRSDGTVERRYGERAYQSGDESLADAITDGTTTVYKLTTPTTETAQPFQSPMIVGATEEYVSDSVVPVGHESKYYEDVAKKVSGLPKDFSTLIAPTEVTFTATRNYSVGSYLIVKNQLYKVTSAISSGGTITPNSNVTATTIMAEILALA